ncbi:hypothetical protein [Streptomyces sp. NPDC048462]
MFRLLLAAVGRALVTAAKAEPAFLGLERQQPMPPDGAACVDVKEHV